MARPKTKGPTIAVQLPLAVDAEVRDAARAARMSPGAYLASIVLAWRKTPRDLPDEAQR